MGGLNIQEIYISVDVETAGPIPATYSLLSIGASVIEATERHFYAELKPLNGNYVPEALTISGLSLTNLAERGEEPAAALKRFRDWVVEISSEGRKPVFVGFNAAFDWSFINWYFHQYVGENPFGFSPLDIKSYYMGLSGCLWGETTSSKLPEHFQSSRIGVAHNALEDARAQGEIFEKLLAGR